MPEPIDAVEIDFNFSLTAIYTAIHPQPSPNFGSVTICHSYRFTSSSTPIRCNLKLQIVQFDFYSRSFNIVSIYDSTNENLCFEALCSGKYA
ncbi:hypothetical protein Cha6605_0652 [Chamaesiphon minutus PCC 6605]|uniref:Uncharacterized protein n=1 Tax=Chamaesiphon minutus (strain ATCC 27169 / PCC 6605) TaxID=1173020 RepID=K9UCJ2_CHAP6|nr:hypothetical protein Cha6605_0652 [Chamaesiphon minutus PCC 6605]